ncbi:DgyrCDS8292 [Dimorphilus gyrociliatus]|uniref:RNA polymerase II-associated factor 1 homolog n=1 Tax=Dimorphilus gyrociliatus TaxID=2664684 RepID=A0A7I8VVF4_9ANNE|nr:DgyrCDS8292 [Dimorphilus gyrociliatus]
MAPTVQSAQRDDPRRRTGEKRSDLVCRIKYNNKAPDIPFDPKFLVYPIDRNHFVHYKPTSLERTHKSELLTEPDLGMNIDLINPDAYNPPLTGGILDPEDEQLLEEELITAQDAKRSQRHNRNVSWLRKTEYISTEYNRFVQKSGHEARVGHNVKQYLAEENLYKDKEEQIKAIEKTFNAAQAPITEHYSKKGVHPVSILPVYPDFDMWKYPCAQVIFDTDPAIKQAGTSNQLESDEMSNAMIRGMVDAETGEHFVAYFLPTEETCRKRKIDNENGVDYDPEEEYDYGLIREYNWTVKNKMTKGYEETYFFVMREDGVYYNELETRVRLSKRRKIGPSAQQTCKSRLIVKHRPPNDNEIEAQDNRLQMLEPPVEEEEEAEEPNDEDAEPEEEEEREIEGDNDAENDRISQRSPNSPQSESSEKSGPKSPASSSQSGSGSESGSESDSSSSEDND